MRRMGVAPTPDPKFAPSIKRVLLNDSLRVDLDKVIGGCEVLVVKGALGTMGAGNTVVLMQLLMGMLDAALARQQDLVPAGEQVAVASKRVPYF